MKSKQEYIRTYYIYDSASKIHVDPHDKVRWLSKEVLRDNVQGYAPNAVQSIVRAKGLYLAKQVKSDTWRIVGRPCGQFHGWSIVLICCTICIITQVKAIL